MQNILCRQEPHHSVPPVATGAAPYHQADPCPRFLPPEPVPKGTRLLQEAEHCSTSALTVASYPQSVPLSSMHTVPVFDAATLRASGNAVLVTPLASQCIQSQRHAQANQENKEHVADLLIAQAPPVAVGETVPLRALALRPGPPSSNCGAADAGPPRPAAATKVCLAGPSRTSPAC